MLKFILQLESLYPSLFRNTGLPLISYKLKNKETKISRSKSVVIIETYIKKSQR